MPDDPKVKEPEMGEWTKEPWENRGQAYERWWIGTAGASQPSLNMAATESEVARVLSCVNALAGVEDPDSVRELVRAAREVSAWLEQGSMCAGDRPALDLRTALSKFPEEE